MFFLLSRLIIIAVRTSLTAPFRFVIKGNASLFLESLSLLFILMPCQHAFVPSLLI